MNFNATFLGQLIAFAFFVWFCMKFVWPLLLGMIEAREQRIADGLAAGERGEKKLVEAEQRFQVLIEEGKQKAADIISQAQKRGDEIIDEAGQAARVEGERQIEMAHSEIEQEKERARQELKQQVARLALVGAEQILMREVDQQKHAEVLARISTEL